MLNRLIVGAVGLVAGSLVAATPAVLGLSGNSSFSRDIKLPVPSGAHSVSFGSPSDGDDGALHDVGDDHGGRRSGSDDGASHDVGDDHGGRRSGSDDSSGPSGGDSSSGSSGGDESGSGSGHGGSDDGSGREGRG